MPSEIDFTAGEKGPAGGMDAVFASMADDEEGDELYGEAKKAVIEAGKASTSYLQRKLGVGYSRAAKLIDMLEERGVIGKGEGSKPREVIGAGNADELVAQAEAAEEVEGDGGKV
jgi:DNA segregation ATPase FtsK/SpoIIIE-like protein